MAADQKTEMECWVVNEASDLATAIDAATELVAKENGYLSHVIAKTTGNAVAMANLIKTELTDGSFNYEIELV